MARSNPTGADVAGFLGRADDVTFVAQCTGVVSLVRAMAESHTRGRGFEEDKTVPNDIYAALLSRAARMAVNPLSYMTEQVDTTATSDRFADDWNRGERRILDRYRVKSL